MQGEETKIKKTNYFILASLGIVVMLLLIFCYLGILISKDVIYPNIKIEGIHLGGLTKEEAKKKIIKEYIGAPGEKNLKVTWGKKRWFYTYEQLGVEPSIEKAVGEAYKLGRKGNVFKKMLAYSTLKSRGENLYMPVTMNQDKIKKVMKDLNKDIKQDAVDAKIKATQEGFIVTPEKSGFALDEQEIQKRLQQAIVEDKTESIALPIATVSPKITQEILKNIKEKVAGFSTEFKGSSWQRGENIKLAASKIDGTVLLPGEVFSTNDAISPITKVNGYLDAPVIVGGQLEPGVGGGVCQVSTTMYNAAVRANLEIVERRHHSFPVHYVPIGQDAMITGDWSDMKFKNVLDTPIYIQMHVSGSTLVTNIYGDNHGVDREIQLQTHILETLPPKTSYKEDKNQYSDYKAEKKTPKTGYKANVYKVIYENGKQVKKELLHHDYYKPVNGLIVVGTKEKKTAGSTLPHAPTKPEALSPAKPKPKKSEPEKPKSEATPDMDSAPSPKSDPDPKTLEQEGVGESELE